MQFLINLKTNKKSNIKIKSVCDEIEKKLQLMFAGKKYGDGVIEWQQTIFCESLEFYKINYRTKFFSGEPLPTVIDGGKFETNRWIDNEELGKSNEKEIYRIICESILKPIYRLSKVKDFDYQAFHDDIIDLFRQAGWIYMSFFMTGETESTVGEKIRFGRNSIEDKIKLKISTKDYGLGINYWGHIIICMTPDTYEAGFFKEIKKYTKKDGDVELRLRINYESMLKANNVEVDSLICESILKGIDIAENELKIPNFDFDAFRKDLTDLFEKEGWI